MIQEQVPMQGGDGDESDIMYICPPTLEFDSTPFGVAFHPSQELIAAGFITGHIRCYKYSLEGQETVFDEQIHRKSCRSLVFSNTGDKIYSGSRDKSIREMDSMTGDIILTRKHSHEDAINVITCIDNTLYATGDDSGVVKLWDARIGKEESIQTYSFHSDYVSDFIYLESRKQIVTTSGDGTIGILDLRKISKSTPMKISEDQEDELVSGCIIKGENKVLCGTQSGAIHIFSTGDWGDCTDRFMGHPVSVDSMISIRNDYVITGAADGLIRLCSTLPNKFIGLIGEHEDGFSVEDMDISFDGKWLASAGGDETVRFWSVDEMFKQDEEMKEIIEGNENENKNEIVNSEDSDECLKEDKKRKKKKQKQKKNKFVQKNDFFSGL